MTDGIHFHTNKYNFFFLNVFWWPSWSLFIMCTYTLDEDDDDDDGAGAGQRGGLIRLESLAVLYGSFSSSSCLWYQDRAFVFPLGSLGLPCSVWGVVWQTGTLFNRTGVVPVRLNTVYALNRLHPTGLEPGPPALYLAKLTSLALHTVFPLCADRRVGSPA